MWKQIFWGVFALAAIIAVFGLLSTLPRQNYDNNYEAWLNSFDALIKAGKIFPGWVKTFWYEHGSPLFVFYPPLFFYLAEIPRLLGLSLVMSVKIVVILSTLGAFFSMYWLGRELSGKWGGLIAGLIYLTAPHHFALIYTRGAFAENLAYAIFPLIIFFIYKLFHDKSWKYIIGLAVSGAALIMTNLPSLLLFGVFVLFWTIGLVIIYKKFPLSPILISGIGALGLSAFYWLPVIINMSLVQTYRFISGNYSFSNYFVSLPQLFDPTRWGMQDYFQLGWVSILIVAIIIYYLVLRPVDKEASNNRLVIMFLISLFIILLLITRISSPVWSAVHILQYIQFPFRFLCVVFILVALLAAYLGCIAKPIWRVVLLILLFAQAIFFAQPVWPFLPDIYKQDFAYTTYGDIGAQYILKPGEKKHEDGVPLHLVFHTAEAGYMPNAVNKQDLHDEFNANDAIKLVGLSLAEAATYTVSVDRKIISTGVISNFKETPTGASFNYSNPSTSRVTYRQLAFPGWKVWIDGQTTAWTPNNNHISFIVVAGGGSHDIKITYTNPPGAVAGRSISLLFALLLVIFVSIKKRRSIGYR